MTVLFARITFLVLTFVKLVCCRQDVNLYTYLTGVRWEYDCAEEDIKGCILAIWPSPIYTLSNVQSVVLY